MWRGRGDGRRDHQPGDHGAVAERSDVQPVTPRSGCVDDRCLASAGFGGGGIGSKSNLPRRESERGWLRWPDDLHEPGHRWCRGQSGRRRRRRRGGIPGVRQTARPAASTVRSNRLGGDGGGPVDRTRRARRELATASSGLPGRHLGAGAGPVLLRGASNAGAGGGFGIGGSAPETSLVAYGGEWRRGRRRWRRRGRHTRAAAGAGGFGGGGGTTGSGGVTITGYGGDGGFRFRWRRRLLCRLHPAATRASAGVPVARGGPARPAAPAMGGAIFNMQGTRRGLRNSTFHGQLGGRRRRWRLDPGDRAWGGRSST